MPQIRFECPQCENDLSVASELEGSSVLCRHCGERVKVPRKREPRREREARRDQPSISDPEHAGKVAGKAGFGLGFGVMMGIAAAVIVIGCLGCGGIFMLGMIGKDMADKQQRDLQQQSPRR